MPIYIYNEARHNVPGMNLIDKLRFVGVKLCDLIGIAKSLAHRCAAFTDAKMSLCARASDAFGQPETDNSELPI